MSDGIRGGTIHFSVDTGRHYGPAISLSPETCERCVTVADGTRYACSLHRPTPAPVTTPGRYTGEGSFVSAEDDPFVRAFLSFADHPSAAHACTDPQPFAVPQRGSFVNLMPSSDGPWKAMAMAFLLKRDGGMR